jgi:hypothetical protein
LGKGVITSTRKYPSTVLITTVAIVITIGVRGSRKERNVAAVTALVTVKGVEAANS